MGCIPDFRLAPEGFFGSGDEVVTLGRYLGTAKETGVELDLPFAHVWTVRDGKVARYRQYMDTVKFNEVLAGQPAA